MFEGLSENLKKAWGKLTGKNKISSADLDEVLAEVRKSLLEGDVALTAVNYFISKLRSSALDQPIESHLTAEQFIIKLANKELINLMGDHVALNLHAHHRPAVLILVGLQGSGKTTTSAKLAKYIQAKHNKKVMLASCDIYRPAAILQLEQVASQVGVDCFSSLNSDFMNQITSKNHASDDNNQDLVVKIAQAALMSAKARGNEVLIIDTAGRMHIDHLMMDEAKLLNKILNPIETLFVVDGMTGQDAAKVAVEFNSQLPLTGVILTKLDGDARGGAALSIRYITDKPIKFYTSGEKLDQIELFYPDRIASRILGMGDLLSLIEEIEAKVDKEKAEKLAKKVIKGQFNFYILRDQLLEMKKIGGINNLIDKIPGLAAMSGAIKSKINDEQVKIMLAIIDSMTAKERTYPALLNIASRKSRICKGSGTTNQDLSKLIRHYQQMEKMTKKLANPGNLLKMMEFMKDKLPPGFTNMK